MLLGYNTNGLAHHDLCQAIDLLGSLGYQAVALTIDHGALNPYAAGCAEQVAAVRERLAEHAMAAVVETGARFLLDPRRKHDPTLVSPEAEQRERRIAFTCRAIDIAGLLEAPVVSLWSGRVEDEAADEVVWRRLVDGLRAVLEYAAQRGVQLGFEPEPGMFIDTMDRFGELLERIELVEAGRKWLHLTLDIGHLQCLGEIPLEDTIQRWAGELVNVHIEDMCRGRHEHLMFGQGEIDFPPVVAALAATRYAGPLNVELSRHSHEGPAAARQAAAFLRPLLENAHGR